jgi:hypothetical protein
MITCDQSTHDDIACYFGSKAPATSCAPLEMVHFKQAKIVVSRLVLIWLRDELASGGTVRIVAYHPRLMTRVFRSYWLEGALISPSGKPRDCLICCKAMKLENRSTPTSAASMSSMISR